MKKIINILLLAGLAALFPSCEKNLEIEPESQLDASGGFKTKQDVDAALFGCYNACQNANYMGLRYFIFADMYADVITHTGTFPSFAQIWNKAILPDNVEISNMWSAIYSGINRCNNVITAAPGVTDPSFNKNNSIGEARFLRAYHYFNLLRYFGGSETGYNKANGAGVPIVLKPTLTSGDAVALPRSSEADVWKAIMEDLDFAIANLNNSNGTGRVNKAVATALKARAHLYKGEWADAENLAGQLIANTSYKMMTGSTYADMYLKKNTTEAIWELQFDINNTNSIAFFYYPTTLGGRNEVSSSTTLNNAHEANDIRKAVNVTTSPANKTQKYTRVAGDDNVILIRLAEMYLIRAEARAMQNKFTDALADLNVIRSRAGLANSTAADQAALLDAIEKERRIEFAHEGHRWFDVRRYNKLASVGITSSFRALWPIPQREVQVSNNIIAQNTGY